MAELTREDRRRNRKTVLEALRSETGSSGGDVAGPRDAQSGRDGESGGFVIARDHHGADASNEALLDRCLHFITRRVHFPDQPEQHRMTGELFEAGFGIQRRSGNLGHRDEPERAAGEGGAGLFQR